MTPECHTVTQTLHHVPVRQLQGRGATFSLHQAHRGPEAMAVTRCYSHNVTQTHRHALTRQFAGQVIVYDCFGDSDDMISSTSSTISWRAMGGMERQPSN